MSIVREDQLEGVSMISKSSVFTLLPNRLQSKTVYIYLLGINITHYSASLFFYILFTYGDFLSSSRTVFFLSQISNPS